MYDGRTGECVDGDYRGVLPRGGICEVTQKPRHFGRPPDYFTCKHLCTLDVYEEFISRIKEAALEQIEIHRTLGYPAEEGPG